LHREDPAELRLFQLVVLGAARSHRFRFGIGGIQANNVPQTKRKCAPKSMPSDFGALHKTISRMTLKIHLYGKAV
jgi:hypothetical protein